MTTFVAPLPIQDPIRANQHTFRRTLDALATPGQLQQLQRHPSLHQGVTDHNRQLDWATTLLLMLLDHEVTLATTEFETAAELGSLLERRTRVALTDPASADVVVTDLTGLEPSLLNSLRRGSLQYPDDSATLVILVENLGGQLNGKGGLRLEGPGIPGTVTIANPGFSTPVLDARAEANSQYPMGIDLLVLDREGRLLGLPRTTSVTPVATGKEV